MPRHLARVLVALTLCAAVTACGTDLAAQGSLANGQPQLPGQAPGTVELTTTAGVAEVVQHLQDAITANGGTVVAVVDHAAEAHGIGVEIPANTLVIGASPAAQMPLLAADQRAGATLPQRYLVHREAGGPVTVTYNGAPYVAAVSGIVDPAARTALRDTSAGIAAQATGATGDQLPAPLVDVTPAGFLITVFGSADVSTTVARLRRAVGSAPSRTAAVVDLAGGSAAFGPPLRPTTVVLVDSPGAQAPLLAAAPGMGLELPMRYLVWLDDQNRTLIGYPDVGRLAQRHGIAATDPAMARLAVDVDRIARTAAGLIG